MDDQLNQKFERLKQEGLCLVCGKPVLRGKGKSLFCGTHLTQFLSDLFPKPTWGTNVPDQKKNEMKLVKAN